MIRLFHPWRPVALVLCLATLTAAAAPFVAPLERVPPFRRDRLPINAEAMRALGNHLLALALAEPMGDEPERSRALAQALALARALDPENETVTILVALLLDGGEWVAPDTQRVSQARERVWQMHAWLSGAESGADANLLAKLMRDSISLLDRQSEAGPDTSGGEPQGEWDGWVAPVSAFQLEPVPADPKAPGSVDPAEPVEPVEMAETAEPKPPAPEVKLTEAGISTVFQIFDRKLHRWTTRAVEVNMLASDGGFQILIPGRGARPWVREEELMQAVNQELAKAFGVAPTHGRVRLIFDPRTAYSFERNQGSICGPAWLLAHAALSGIEPEGLFIGELNDNQEWVLPEFFWRMIMALAESDAEGGRLVVPASAQGPLLNLLAMERPGFFLKYEVLVASSADEFVKLTAKKRSEEQIAVSEKFREIKERAGVSALGVYLSNRFVLERLESISEQAPYHLSARLLARQGSGSRPRFMTKDAIAAELWRRIESLRLPLEFDPGLVTNRDIAALREFNNQIREDVKAVKTYAEFEDVWLIEETLKLADATRDLLHILSDSRQAWQKYEDVKEGQRKLGAEYHKLRRKLSRVSGDPIR